MNRILREAARFVGGSLITYVVVAACSAGGFSNPGSRVSTNDDSNRDGGAGNPAQSRDGGSGSEDDPTPSVMDPIVDPVPSANAEPTDGSRLKAVYRVAADGAREPVANQWWDSERGEYCSWRVATDGTTRCMPISLAPGASVAFGNAGCTQEVAVIPRAYCDGETPPRYASAFAIECTSELASRVLELGTTTSTIYNRNAEGACTDVSAAFNATYVGYRVTEVQPSAFIAATLEHD